MGWEKAKALKQGEQVSEAGVYLNSNEDYHRGPGMSASHLKELLKTGAHYRTWLQSTRRQTDEMRIGEAVHAKLLEPDTFEGRFALSPSGDGRTKEFKAFAEANAGKTILKPDHIETMNNVIHSITENVLKDADYSKLFLGLKEHAFYWTDPDTGILCKCRPDIISVTEGIITDLKVVEDASPKAFEYTLGKMLYYLQAAFYLDGVKHCLEQSGCNLITTVPDAFVFVAAEREAPNGIGKYALEEGSAALKEGRRLYKKALQTYSHCVKTGEWKAYPRDIQAIDLPNWSLYAFE